MTYLQFALFSAALLLNIKDKPNIKMLAFVVFTIFFPVRYVENYYIWFATVIALDAMLVAITCISESLVSKSLFMVSIMLVNAHLLAYETEVESLYYYIAQYLEHLQIVCFIICAPSLVYYLKRKVRGWIKRYGYGY